MLIPKKKSNKTNWKKAPVAAALSLALLTSLVPFSASAASATPSADTTLTFSESGVSASGAESGYKIEGTALTINAAGTYKITGSCSEGSITVKKGTTGVTLLLDGLDLTSTTTAPLSCNKTTEVTVYVANTASLTDDEDPANEESADAEVADAFEGAAIKVKSGASLDITGSGTLYVNGNAKNGVKGASEAAVTVDGGTVKITAANNGLASDGSVTVNGGTLDITSQNDGIKAEPDEDDTASAGTIAITGGKVTLNATGDGIQATNKVSISGGTFDITTFGGYTKAKALEQADESAKGIKSDNKVSISGGSFTLNTANDAVHSNGDLSITGGNFAIRSGDDAIHADNDVSVAGAEVNVASCNEGIEGARVFLESGSGTIVASDDGVNAATDLAVSEVAIYLNGGTWKVNAGGDGLDAGGDSSNNRGGDIHINGGETLVFGSANAGNSALDFDGSCTYQAGTLLAVGMNGMAQSPTSGVSVVFNGTNISNGSAIAVKDSAGNTLYSATAVKNANHVIYCGEGLTSGSSYTLYVNNKAAGTATAGVTAGQMGGMNGQNQQNGQMPGMNNQNQQNGQMPGMNSQNQQNGQMPGMNNQNQQSGQMPGMDNQNQQNSEPPALPDQGQQAGQAQTPPDTQAAPGSADGIGSAGKETVPEAVQETAGTVAGFSDVAANAWYAPAVSWAKANSVMNGVSNTRFAPLTNLNRGMMVQILYNLEGRPTVEGEAASSDVNADAWYADAVEWAKENGTVSGYDNGSFGPADPITRAQTAVILRNYAQFKGEETDSAAPLNFADAASVPAWAGSALSWAVEQNILQGDNNGLNPNTTANRAQIATMMMRYLDAQ